jgi:AcrR family transcriptional regulator
MAGRPRTITDDRILAAVASAIGKVGPGRLTLADVAREADVSTGALVQRFGNKRGLLLAFLRAADPAATMRDTYNWAYAATGDPVTGLVEAIVALAGPERSAAEFANHLAFLHLELADAEFRQGLFAFDAAVRAELSSYVDEAVLVGRLDVDDTARLVDALTALLHGIQITWAIRRTGSLADAMRAAVISLLSAHAPLT